MRTILFLFFILITQNSFSSISKVKKGDWVAELNINSTYKLPVRYTIKSNKIIIKNAEERIELIPKIDSLGNLYIPFNYYHSKIVITSIKKKKMSGYWHNMAKGKDYKIPLTSSYLKKRTISKNEYLDKFSGKWEVRTKSNEKLIGEFKNDGIKLYGTFLTETGDYRFLEGNVTSDSMYLSCFDGSHAFLFTANLKNDTLSGDFHSGTHYHTTWTAFKNENAVLTNPEELTYIVNDSKINFSLKNTENFITKFPNTNNKYTIIQILGTWCPNCIDETKYLTEIFPQYKNEIDFIGIAFERKSSVETQLKKLKDFKSMMSINYEILLGGNASKNEALNLFPMLNKIIAFPTLLVLDKNQNIIKTHAGFNGPGTGIHYINYKKKMGEFLDSLTLN